MSDIDPNQEWNQLTEVYGQMADEELLNLASQENELTDIARDVLQGEIKARGLQCEPSPKLSKNQRDSNAVALPLEDREQALVPEPIHAEGLGGRCRYASGLEGAGLIEWDRANSMEEALRVRDVLAAENITVAFGREMLENPEEVASYLGGVPVIISVYDRQRAEQAWAEANPEEYLQSLEQAKEEQEEPAEAACCPSCRSLEIVLLNVKNGSKGEQVFRWRCDACGHKWADDGVAQYKPLPEAETEENL